jgi:small multidrug resistance pump
MAGRGGRVTPFWLLLAAAIGASIVGNILLKIGSTAPDFVAQLLDWRTLVGLVLYGTAALFYMVALRRLPISVALPFTAVSYIAAAFLGHYLFHEAIAPLHIAGIVLISGGVVLVALS